MTWADLQELVAPFRQATAETQTPPALAAAPASPTSQSQPLSPEDLAAQATVRFRIEDSAGTSFATGTIIHRVENEALVLTCGHVFRDSDGKGTIHADIGFHLGEPVTVTGSLISWDAGKHDIALVAIPCPLPLQAVQVAPEGLAMQTGDRLFSLGCDRGDPPTVRQTALKGVANYSGVSKYDTIGRPVDGRSGGGLFTLGGQLVGVCNAAAVEVDEGIYTGLESVYWQFASAHLTHLFRDSGDAATMVATSGGPAMQPTDMSALDASPARPPANRDVRPVAEPPTRPVSLASASDESEDTEVIILIRSAANPGETEAFTVRDPDPRMLEWIDQARRQRADSPQDPRLATRTDLPERRPVPSGNEPVVRGQSPR
jgi:hypothetical protein